MAAGGIGGVEFKAQGRDDGISALTTAVERSARLRLLQAQIPTQIEEADAAVAAAYASLGITMPSAPKGKRAVKVTAPREPRTPSGPLVPEPGSNTEAIWDLLPATVDGIAESLSMEGRTVGAILGGLSRRGHAFRDDSTTTPIWRRMGPPDAPLASPAFAGNGAAAE